MSNTVPAGTEPSDERTLASLARALDRAVRGDSDAFRACEDDGAIALIGVDRNGNIERSWCLGADVAAELVDGDWLSGREIGYAIDLAEAACKAVAA